ncbi:DUF58 domain-containing protein [Rubinisphaera margarita]|uniref:DUF58 domain-containing protein n=1 Tax=Rubinisphaera margarita TaxID=2909586 RepID=UPI001EE8964B|nr:DUF58 domain-containing protein [Rubinisphaera margarita]MCG6155915.1 DUF58 domain-containing protein [Rubinisphaera margarita]
MISFLKSTFRKPQPSQTANEAPRALLDAEVMNQIGHLELLSRTVVDGLLAGKHRSSTRGGCCEFAEHRQYAPGDEIRQIDWQVYARNDRYFIRQFEEETNLHGILALDTSGSMRFGLSTPAKLDYAKQLAACLGRLLLKQRDAVGAAILNDQNPYFVPPRQHAAHLQALLSALQAAEASNAGDLGLQIRGCLPRFKRRGLFILCSDCFTNLDELSGALRVVRSRGHDVVVLQILAPEEVHFEFRHWSSFRSLESSGQTMHLDPAAIRSAYLKRFESFLADLEERVVGLGGDYLRMTTDQNLADVLGWFLRMRMARNKRRS